MSITDNTNMTDKSTITIKSTMTDITHLVLNDFIVTIQRLIDNGRIILNANKRVIIPQPVDSDTRENAVNQNS